MENSMYSNKEAFILFFSMLVGSVSSLAGGHTTGLVGLELFFAFCILNLIFFSENNAALRSYRAFTFVVIFFLSCVYGVMLYLAGDRLKVVFFETTKLLIFFVSAEFIRENFKVSYYTLLIGLGYYVGLIYTALAFPYEQAADMSEVAKWVAPPGYIMLMISIALYYLKRFHLVFLLVPIPAYGIFFGGARGSTLGALFIISILVILRFSRPIYFFAMKFRKLIIVGVPVLTMVVPVYIGTEVLDIDANDGDHHTKSNLERSTMMMIALWRILENPWLGTGTEDGYARVVEYFDANLYGYTPTTSLHNQLLDSFYFGGFFGFVSVLALFCMLFAKMWKPRSTKQHSYVSLAAILSISFYMAVEPFSSKARTCDLLAVAACCIVATKSGKGERLENEKN